MRISISPPTNLCLCVLEGAGDVVERLVVGYRIVMERGGCWVKVAVFRDSPRTAKPTCILHFADGAQETSTVGLDVASF
jgi:hypothetical protein